MFLGCKIFRSFCTQFKQKVPLFNSNIGADFASHQNDILLDQLVKGFKKAYQDRFLLDFKKIVLPAKRIRTLDDHIQTLWKNHEVAVVIEGRDEFDDIDLVLDYYQIAAVKRRICANVAPIYIRIPGYDHDIRCTLGEITKDPKSHWPFKVQLQRYIVGRPNLLYVPINITKYFNNPSLMRGTDFDLLMEGVWVYSYNTTYPSYFFIDPKNIRTYRPYKLGDLQNTFPQGIILHEKYKKLIHWNVLTITKDEDDRFFEDAEYQRSKNEAELVVPEAPEDGGEEFVEGDMKFRKQKKLKEKKQKKQREKSLKKRVKQANLELQKEVAAQKEAKDQAAKEAAAQKK